MLSRAFSPATRQRLLSIDASNAGVVANRHQDQALRWAEEEDKEKVVYELFGILPFTAAQSTGFQAALTHNRLILTGANGTGKSFMAAVKTIGIDWHVNGYLPGPDGQPQGCVLLIIAPKQDQVFAAYKAHFLQLGRMAMARGHRLAGWGSHSERSVLWTVSPRWYMQALVVPRQAARSMDSVSHYGLGPHHSNMRAWLEELAGIAPSLIEALKGRLITDGNSAIASTNPTAAGGMGYMLSQREKWPTIYSSTLDHPNIVNRRTVIPSACGHLAVESDLRNPMLFRDIGSYPSTQPDEMRGDVVYALPPPPETLEDKLGPRDDGISGHPDVAPVVLRPLAAVAFGRIIGTWPTINQMELFSQYMVDRAQELWTPPPAAQPPLYVAADCAPSPSGDENIGMAWWGATPRELWEACRLLVARGVASTLFEAACGLSDGSLNHRWVLEDTTDNPVPESGRDMTPLVVLPHVSMPIQLPIEPVTAAELLIGKFGKLPEYRADMAFGGALLQALADRGCNVYRQYDEGPGLAFNARADPPLPGQVRAASNARAQMFLDLADLVTLELIPLPPCQELIDDLRALGQPIEVEQRTATDDETGTRIPVFKIKDKQEISELLGRSTDWGDALAMVSVSSRAVLHAPRADGIMPSSLGLALRREEKLRKADW